MSYLDLTKIKQDSKVPYQTDTGDLEKIDAVN